MANDTPKSALESVNEVYAQRVANLAEADQKDRDDIDALDEGFDHSESVPAEEAKFVANPDDLRKEVDSEDKFSETLEDNPVDVEVGSTTVTEPADPEKPVAKKTTSSKTAAKK